MKDSLADHGSSRGLTLDPIVEEDTIHPCAGSDLSSSELSADAGPTCPQSPDGRPNGTGDRPAGDPSIPLMEEAHHRFFNSLQVIQSATNAILRARSTDRPLRDELEGLKDRIALLAEVNRYLAGPFGPAVLSKDSLRRFCTILAASFASGPVRIKVSVEGSARSIDRSQTILLLLSELMINALKYGASDQALQVFVGLTVRAGGCRLEVTNNLSEAPKRSIKPRVAENLVRSIGGTLETKLDGLNVQIHASLPSS